MSKRIKNQSAAPTSNGTGADPGAASGPAEGATQQRRPAVNAASAANAASDQTNSNSSEPDLTDLLMSAVEDSAPTTAKPPVNGVDRNHETNPEPERELEAPAAEDGVHDGENSVEEDPTAGDQAEEAQAPAAADDPEAEAEEDLSDLASMDDEQLEEHAENRGWPESYLKRVKKFTRQLRAAESRARKLEEAAEEQGAADAERPRSDESAIRNSQSAIGAPSARESGLMAQIAQTEEWLDRIEAVAPGESLVIGDQTFGPEALRKSRRKLETQLSALTVERTTAERQRADLVRQGEAEAVTRHPWLKDRSHADTVAINRAFNEYPVLKGVPFVRALLADGVAFRRLQAARAKTESGKAGERESGREGAAQQRRPTAPQSAFKGPGRPAAAPMPAQRRGPDTNAGVKKALESGRMEDAVAVIGDLVGV